MRRFVLTALVALLIAVGAGMVIHGIGFRQSTAAAYPCSSEACINKFKVLGLLEFAQRNGKTISGMYAGDARIFEPHWWEGAPAGDTIWEQFIGHVEDRTGELVGIAEFRFTASGPRQRRADLESLTNQIEREIWDRGAIPAISDHMTNPWTGDEGRDRTVGEFEDLLTPGNEVYDRFHQELDWIAAGLKELGDRAIPVLFRPFHEDTGGWFWWGSRTLTDEQYQRLWHYVFDYMESEKGLDHLIWVYGPSTSNSERIGDRYPGDDYVDIVGVSNYRCNPSDADVLESYRILQEVAPDKPFAFTELGPDKDENCRDTYNTALIRAIESQTPDLLYFLNWYGPTAALALYPNAEAVLQNPNVLNADDLLALRDSDTVVSLAQQLANP